MKNIKTKRTISYIIVIFGLFSFTTLVYAAPDTNTAPATPDSGISTQRALDTDSDGDGVSDSIKDNEPDQASVNAFIKVEGIEGESTDSSNNSRETQDKKSDSTDFTLTPDRIERSDTGNVLDDDSDDDSIDEIEVETSSKDSKPKEIIIVGSKIREALKEGAEVRGWDPVKKEIIIKTEDVKTEEDLNDYAKALLASDGDVLAFSWGTTHVGIAYEQPVKLFGLFSIAMKQKVDVSTNPDEVGRVKVRFPWWSFLAKKTISSDEIKTTVDDTLKSTTLEVTDTQQESRKYQILSNIMKASHDAAMAVVRNIR